MGQEPEEQSQSDADHQAGNYREIESGVLAAMDDVAGKPAEAQRKFSAEVEKRADDDEEPSQNEEGAAYIAE
jgi:hypothetical protein